MDSAGIAQALYIALTASEEAGSELSCFSSESTAPGDMIVQRILSVCASMRRPSVRVRIASFVAQYTVPPGANTLMPKTGSGSVFKLNHYPKTEAVLIK